MPQNEHGAFLIRDSESRRNDFSLSVRDGDTVKHYRIRQLDEGGFFIARRTTFRTLQELVDHYSRDADGLCVNLRKPCVQVNISGFQMWWKNTFCLFLDLQLIKDVLFEVMFIIRNKIGNWNSFKVEKLDQTKQHTPRKYLNSMHSGRNTRCSLLYSQWSFLFNIV